MRSARYFAPATVANVAVGFDVLGFALGVAGDVVSVQKISERKVRLKSIQGETAGASELPSIAEKNTATAGLCLLLQERGLAHGFEVSVEKGIAMGSGMGGSAASAAASAAAASALLEQPLTRSELLRYALEGERAASGSLHGDNVAPALLGGLQLVLSCQPPEVLSLKVPSGLACALIRPRIAIETRAARAILRPEIPLQRHVEQSARLAAFVYACQAGQLDLLGRVLEDVIIEPQRKNLIPGFDAVKVAALRAGALGCSISGSGPAIFAIAKNLTDAGRIREAMVQVLGGLRIQADSWAAEIDLQGARPV